MPLPTRQLVLSALLGTALATAETRAQTPMTEKAGEKQTDTAKLLEEIKKDVGDLKRDRNDLIDVVFGKADGKTAADQGILRRLSELESKMTSIQSALTRIESLLKDPSRSTSAYPPSSAPGAAPGATVSKAHVRLVNDYPTEISMMVNGRSHRLMPGEVKMVEVTVGSYTYELLHAGAQPKTAAIREGETITLRVN